MAEYLRSLLPGSIAADPTIAAMAKAVDAEHQAIHELVPSLVIHPELDQQPDEVLEHLAVQYGVADLWDLLESREEKCHVLKHFFDFQRLRGTKSGLDLYCRTYLKRDVLEVSEPYQSVLHRPYTDEDLAAWEAPHPEIRLYPFRPPVGVEAHCVLADWTLDVDALQYSDASMGLGQRVTMYDPQANTETELDRVITTDEVIEHTTVTPVTVRPRKDVGGHAPLGDWALGLDALAWDDPGKGIFTLLVERTTSRIVTSQQMLSVRPSLQPMRIESESTPITTTWQAGFALGFCALDQDAVATAYPEDHIYRRFKLFDPERALTMATRIRSGFVLGHTRLGPGEPHQREVAVDSLRVAEAGLSFMGKWVLGVDPLGESRLPVRDWVDRICRVVNATSRLSDRIMVRTQNYGPVTFGDQHVFGPGLMVGDNEYKPLGVL